MNQSDRSDIEFELIARRLAGEMDASDRARMDESPELRAAVLEGRQVWEISGVPGSVNVEAAWTRFRKRLDDEDVSKVVDIRTARRKWPSTVAFMRVAAAIAVIAGGAVVWKGLTSDSSSAVQSVASRRPAEPTTLELPDGSSVVVGASSSVRLRDGYGQGAREVDLIGEAQFTVTHDEKQPFRVFAAGALVEDLGTEFTVRAFANEPVRVAVSEGSVSVRRSSAQPAQAVTLEPRDMAVLADTGDLVVTRGIDVEVYRAWTRGMLVFRNTALRDAIPELERWYDIDFRIADDALLSRHFTAEFDNQPVDEMLNVLGATIEARFERRGRVVGVEAPVRTGMTPSSAVQVGSGA